MKACMRRSDPIRYQAGAHIAEVESRFGLSRVIKLASNENPLGPSPLALAALQSVVNLHRYPDEKNTGLRQLLAGKLGLGAERILVSNGTTDLIDIIVSSLSAADDEILLFEKTFIYYRVSAHNHGVPFREAPRGPAFTYDAGALIDRIGPRTRLVFLAAPDNPTGVYIARADLERILAALPEGCVLIFDEAYREYVPAALYFDPTEIGDPRLLVLRTFSKCYGLAGFRCGYAVGDPALLAQLARRQAPFSVSALAQAAAGAALLDDAHLERSRRLNEVERAALRQALARRRLPCVGGHGNFLTIDTSPLKGSAVYARLLSQGVIVRPLDPYDLDCFIRVTVGLPEENQIFLQHLSALFPS
jgi:histidinol-phosphate aminotransferase